MERKGSSSTVQGTATVTATEARADIRAEIRAALPGTKTLTRPLTSEEEKVLRMRHGAKQEDAQAPLPRADGGNQELGDELLVIEMQLMKAHRLHLLKAKGKNAARAPIAIARPALDPAGAKAKDKIVRALRKKK